MDTEQTHRLNRIFAAARLDWLERIAADTEQALAAARNTTEVVHQ